VARKMSCIGLARYPASLISLLLFTIVAFAAAEYAAVTRFVSDPALAPRDVAVYKEEVHRVAGAAFLTARKIGKAQVYAPDTVETIGGVIFQETAKPSPGLAGQKLELKYRRDLPDGQRLQIKIGDRTFKSDLFDWALIPISNFTNSRNTAVISLLAKPQSQEEQTFSNNSVGRTFWIQIHPDLRNTLVGFNALLIDAMLLGRDPSSTRNYTEGLKPKVDGWNTTPFNSSESEAASKKIRLLLNASFTFSFTYIFTDLGSEYTFSPEGDYLVVKGRHPTYHFFTGSFPEPIKPDTELTGAFLALTDPTRDGGAMLKSLNPAVFDTANKTAQWAAFFRYVKANHPAKWKAYFTSLDQAKDVLAIETPVAWVRKVNRAE